jgi:16S rRNA processing protein RimM
MMDQNKLDDTVVYLVVGKFRRPHGLRGEMIMEVITDFPERLRSGVQVFVGEKHTEQIIHTRRRYGDDLLIALEGFQNPEQAGELRNELVYVRSDMIPALPDGEFYQHQLLGLRVIGDDGQELGHLEQILETGANDVYLVRSESGAELLLPVIDQVILGIDLPKGEIRVHLLPGLLPD